MAKHNPYHKFIYTIATLALLLLTILFPKLKTEAVDFPHINVTFDPAEESVIVDSIPANSADGSIEYQLEGYLNYEKERVETFCYAPNVRPYDVPAKQAYIFNWSGDAEFLLPCSGDYKFTAYITARYIDSQGQGVEEKGQKTTITITLHKKDESTNWGSGLPNTTVEDYDLGQIKGKDKTIKVEEPDYTWSIYGKDIIKVPDGNISLKITSNPENFQNTGVDAFFGDTELVKFNIEYSGEFGFTAMLDYKLGQQYAGKYANLFYVAGDGTFQYMGHSIVTEEGIASFGFDHASDYILVILDEGYTGQSLNSMPEEKTEETEESEESKEPMIEEPLPAVTEDPADTTDVWQEDTISKEKQQTPESDEMILTIGAKEESNNKIWFGIGGIALLLIIFIAIGITKKKK